jgi:KaiC/GvpD/RAD55 family RecA-like ATPase
MRNYHNEISNSDYNEHNLLVYPDLDAFSKIYSYHTREAIEKNNDYVIIATTYQTIDAVKKQLEYNGVDASKYIKDGSLVIIDSVKGYHMPDVYGVIKLVKSLQMRAEKEGRNGITDFADTGSFFMLEKIRQLLEYEMSVPKKMDLKFRAFCCYHQQDFGTLTKEQQKMMIDHHNRSILVPSA